MTSTPAGAEAAARGLLGKVSGDDQMTAAQQLLDAAAMATLGARMTRTTALQSAARTLQVFLHSYYADNGQYPDRLSLDDEGRLKIKGATRDPQPMPSGCP